MKITKLFAALAAALLFSVGSMTQAAPITVVSQTVEDHMYIFDTIINRNETFLNDGGTNAGRYAAVRFDAAILSGDGSAANDFTNPAEYQLVSATLRVTEQGGRDGLNGSLSGTIGAAFFNTTENFEWTNASLDSVDSPDAGAGDIGSGWFGNSRARSGNFGGTPTGANNIDNRSNGAGNALDNGVAAAAANGYATAAHTFALGVSDIIDIDLTSGGASLAEIQSILNDWVAGRNAGVGFAGTGFGNQIALNANNVAVGLSVGSTIDGDSTFSGLSTDFGGLAGQIVDSNGGTGGADGGSINGAALILQFERATPTIPEPGSIALSLLALSAFGAVGMRRRS